MNKLLSGRRVLLVEDEMLVIMMIEGMLSDLGCNDVVVASTPDSAIALIGEQTFELAMLDMNLDGLESNAVAEALEARGVRFLFCTGNSGEDPGQNARKRPVLRKPFSFQVLTEALTALLAEQDSARAHG